MAAHRRHPASAALAGGRLIAFTAPIGSGKTALARRLREAPDRENQVIVSRALSLVKAKVTVPLSVSALFYDLSPDNLRRELTA